MDHKPLPSGSNDSDHDFEHLEAPDPFELASYHAAGNAQPKKPQAMSQDSPHKISPEHHAIAGETRQHNNDYFNEPTDPIVGAHGDHPHHDVLGHNKEEMLVDFNSTEPVATHHQTYTASQINTDPEPPNVDFLNNTNAIVIDHRTPEDFHFEPEAPHHVEIEHKILGSEHTHVEHGVSAHAEREIPEYINTGDESPELVRVKRETPEHTHIEQETPELVHVAHRDLEHTPFQRETHEHTHVERETPELVHVAHKTPDHVSYQHETPEHIHTEQKTVEHEHRKLNDSPQFPDEPSPAHAVSARKDFEDDDYPKPIRHSPDQEDRKSIEENIHAAVNDTHDEVDAILERLHTPDPAEVAVPPVPEPEHNTPDSERDTVGRLVGESYNEPEPNMPTSDSTHGMRETSPDEQTFDRRGPLTIPEKHKVEKTNDDEFEESSNFNQIPPRPPTPPKDLNDEDVNPRAINLGPAPVHHYEKSPDDTSGLKPILKHHSDVEPWLTNRHVDQRVLDIIHWRDPKKSGITLASIFIVLFLVTKFSLISLVAYSAIAVLIGTLGFRVFKIVDAKFIKKTEDKNPFQPLLEKEIEVPQEKIHAQVDVLVENARSIAFQLRRLFLVENVLDSVKFFFLLYTLTYIGAWFSGFALIILFVIGLFTIPKVYEINKEPIDNYLNLAKENVDKLHQTVGEKLPFLNQCPVAPPIKKEE